MDIKSKVSLIKDHAIAKDGVIDKQSAQIVELTKQLGEAQLKLQQTLPAAPATSEEISQLTIAQAELAQKLQTAQADLDRARTEIAAQQAEFIQALEEIDATIVGANVPSIEPTPAPVEPTLVVAAEPSPL
jgi:septal ring factor EnvC (AmiA/AmiB activator)